MITLVFSILITRVLSGHFSVYDYGTYSQILLLTTTISSLTILGMMDGINFFFCKENNEIKRNSYVSTIFFLQAIVSLVVLISVMICTVPISKYFDNSSLKPLMIYAALLPISQNMISLLQIMFLAIGKAKQIAIRNLIVSVLKFLTIFIACYVFDDIAVMLFAQVVTDLAQVVYFVIVLRQNNCYINIFKYNLSIVKEILKYCIPMAMFTVIKSLNRDCNKFVISAFTDTETLAIYTNASKLLPFDIIMTSFCTVLLPYITRYISQKKYSTTHNLYKAFLEVSYISTTILAVGAICVAPELMRFLYTEKYLSGIYIFIIYILVDIFSVLNITLILSAAGKTKKIMFVSLGVFGLNLVLNFAFYFMFGITGPALATFIVTIFQGLIILSLASRVIGVRIFKMFDFKYLIVFILELVIIGIVMYGLRTFLLNCGVPYMIILIFVYVTFCLLLGLLNFKRIFKNLHKINECKLEK